MSDVVVVGAGVSGLTCALVLARAGHRVRLWSAAPPGTGTSAVAAAVWYAYRAGPAARTAAWAHASWRVFRALARDPRTGIVLRTCLEVDATRDDLPWAPGAGPEVRDAAPRELPPGVARGLCFELPVVPMPTYLAWLVARLAEHAVTCELRRLASFGEALAAAPVVVDCAGLGARELAGDALLVPIRGQVAWVERRGDERILFGHDAAGVVTYVIPRLDDVVLGGTAEVGCEDLTPDAETTAALLARCAALAPELAGRAVRAVKVGLRPGRETVRVEAQRAPGGGLVVHDYGHGGAGVTLSWGCAREVAKLVSGSGARAGPRPRRAQ